MTNCYVCLVIQNFDVLSIILYYILLLFISLNFHGMTMWCNSGCCFLYFFPHRLRVAFLPMLLHLHQCQLDFLIGFFGAKSSSVDQSSGCYQDSDGSKVLPTKSNNLAEHAIAEEAFLPYFQESFVSASFWISLSFILHPICHIKNMKGSP